MKKRTKMIVTLFALFCMIAAFMPTKAAKVPGAASNIKCKEYTYYKYWQANRKALDKAGFYEGEEYDAVISWNASPNATNYKIELFWNPEKGSNYTTIVYARKYGSVYRYSTTGHGKGANLIAPDVKSAIYNGCHKQFRSRKLSFNVTGSIENIHLDKIKITAYNVNTCTGKRFYAKPATLNIEPIATVHNFFVKKVRKTVKVTSDGVNIRTKPWAGAGSQVVGAAGRGQRLQVTGQVYNKDTGKIADWYEINWNGSVRYVNKTYLSNDPNPPKPDPTPDPKPVKKYMTVTGVTNYLGVRSRKTTDYRYEIGRLYNGDKVKVINHSDKTYYYVQGVKTGVKGYVVARFLK